MLSRSLPAFLAAATLAIPAVLAAQQRLPRPRVLGGSAPLARDAASGELRAAGEGASPAGGASDAPLIRSRVTLVQVGCTVTAPDGTPVRGLTAQDFRLFEDGAEQTVASFDAASTPASIALLVDASPSIFRELRQMREAARSLAQFLRAQDEVAVVAFADQTRLLLPFSRDRELLAAALDSPELRQVRNSTESFIYQAVYLTAEELFRNRSGRKAIVLLTDGQDSGLGLTWDPATMRPQPGASSRLAFEDVARKLGAEGIHLHVISTQSRPAAMTGSWLAARRQQPLVTPEAREAGLPLYTLYLAELVRQAGGGLYFLRELGTLAEVYRQVALSLSAEYTLGFYPASGAARPGWRRLRVELRPGAAPPGAALSHRAAYYVPAWP